MDPQTSPIHTSATPSASPDASTRGNPDTKRKAPRGLLEALVAGCVLVSLSGIVMPVVSGEMHGERMRVAQRQTVEIGDALQSWMRSTLYLPTGRKGRTNLAYLYGPGQIPAGNPYAEGGEAAPLADCLLNDTMAGDRFVGGYIGALEPDPWGRAYLVNVDGWLDHREHALVLSAGPNGFVDTPPEQVRAQGDDIIYLLD